MRLGLIRVTLLRQHHTKRFELASKRCALSAFNRRVLRKSWASVNAFRCFFAEGEIGGTPCMRSHIFIHLATTISFAKPFIFKIKIEKEGLPRDSPAGLGAGGPEFKSRRPDQNISRVFFGLLKAFFT